MCHGCLQLTPRLAFSAIGLRSSIPTFGSASLVRASYLHAPAPCTDHNLVMPLGNKGNGDDGSLNRDLLHARLSSDHAWRWYKG
ncbi:hypothetical protein RJT34_23708 [Clitoria ternatea]|uniref:Uncharacterized protein n=1 Tax=Clitoria ternatea TaxID=43366 RepID=A0AAN9FV51_CLITE